MRRRSIAVAVFGLLPAAAGATAFGVFQHGGRATGQAGAFTARAADPSALTYNPAAITRLEGLQLQAGLDFSAPRDDYTSPSGSHAANHVIDFAPEVYLTWRAPASALPLAFGVGLDAPVWYQTDWDTALFPGRFLTRHVALRVLEVHPVLAYELDERWSVGGGLRYVRGEWEQGGNALVAGGLDPTAFPVEATWDADADVDGYGFDLGAQFSTEVWGFGAVLRGPLELEGRPRLTVDLREGGVPPAVETVVDSNLARLRRLPVPTSFEIAPELRTGVWLAPYPELRLELDVAYAAWSQTDNDELLLPQGAADATPIRRDRDWDDTLSLRLGAEGELVAGWTLFGGVAFESSPVSGTTLEPGFPRGDALVYAAGFGFDFPQLSFDVGYSLHDYDPSGARGQELRAPAVTSRYSAHEQVFAVSARWRF